MISLEAFGDGGLSTGRWYGLLGAGRKLVYQERTGIQVAQRLSVCGGVIGKKQKGLPETNHKQPCMSGAWIFILKVMFQGRYLKLPINAIFLSEASVFLEVNNFKHLHIKRNSDLPLSRMQNSHEFLRELRRDF